MANGRPMTEPTPDTEVEEVLSAIRRLIAEGPSGRRKAPATPGPLVLSPTLRVAEPDPAPAPRPEPSPVSPGAIDTPAAPLILTSRINGPPAPAGPLVLAPASRIDAPEAPAAEADPLIGWSEAPAPGPAERADPFAAKEPSGAAPDMADRMVELSEAPGALEAEPAPEAGAPEVSSADTVPDDGLLAAVRALASSEPVVGADWLELRATRGGGPGLAAGQQPAPERLEATPGVPDPIPRATLVDPALRDLVAALVQEEVWREVAALRAALRQEILEELLAIPRS